MDYQEVQTLAIRLLIALEEERGAKTKAADYENAAKLLKARVVGSAYEQDLIDKKNKDTRSAGEARVLAENEEYQSLLTQKQRWEEEAELAAVNRQYWNTLVSLTKAWLYSQSGTNV